MLKWNINSIICVKKKSCKNIEKLDITVLAAIKCQSTQQCRYRIAFNLFLFTWYTNVHVHNARCCYMRFPDQPDPSLLEHLLDGTVLKTNFYNVRYNTSGHECIRTSLFLQSTEHLTFGPANLLNLMLQIHLWETGNGCCTDLVFALSTNLCLPLKQVFGRPKCF